jgi:uncharacterized protein
MVNKAQCVNPDDPATLKADELPFFRPAEQAHTVLPAADVALITGTTLVNDTLDGLLGKLRPKARVTLVGPTVSLLPDAFLRRGVDVLGGVRVTAPDDFLDVLAEGGSGYHFFGRSAERVVLQRRAPATWPSGSIGEISGVKSSEEVVARLRHGSGRCPAS